MSPYSIVGLFCDDIRKEQRGQETIIGVFPDTIKVSPIPGTVPRMCLYIRIHFDPKSQPKSISIKLNRPDDIDSQKYEIEKDVILKTFTEAKKTGHPYAGILSRATIIPFPITQPGRFDIVVTIDGVDSVCGSLLVEEAQSEINS